MLCVFVCVTVGLAYKSERDTMSSLANQGVTQQFASSDVPVYQGTH